MTLPTTRNDSTYADAGVDIAAGEKAVELIKEHVRSTFRPEVVGDVGGFGGLFAVDWKRYRDPLLVSSTDGVGTKSLIARAGRPPRHDRHRLRRDVGRRHRRAGRASRCSSSTTSRSASSFPRRSTSSSRASPRAAARRGARCSAARCRSIPGVMEPGEFDLVGFAVGVVERADVLPARRARRRPHRRHREPGPALQRLLARRAPRCSTAAGRDLDGRGVAGRAPLAGRGAARAERDLRARDAEARERGAGARVRARHRRRHPRQPRARASRSLRRGRPARRRGRSRGSSPRSSRRAPSPTTRWSTCSTSGSACSRSCRPTPRCTRSTSMRAARPRRLARRRDRRRPRPRPHRPASKRSY